MLNIGTPEGMRPVDPAAEDALPLLRRAVWIDMLSPTPEEERLVEVAVGIDVPTREEMIEIEPSSRFYVEDGTIFLTATLLAGVHANDPTSVPVTFVLAPSCLVTVRYHDPKSFRLFIAHADRQPDLLSDPQAVLVQLLDAVIDRLADLLEETAAETDAISKHIFRRGRASRPSRLTSQALELLLSRVGNAQDIVSRVRDSTLSLGRLLSYLSFALPQGNAMRNHLKPLGRDIASLSNHADFQIGNITFLLDASLGLISIQQNGIIKIFSVAAVVFLPPTLVASIYGMNFAHMPELKWLLGYPVALGLMLLSAVLPYLWFKRKGWL